jgi:hypothetical protein
MVSRSRDKEIRIMRYKMMTMAFGSLGLALYAGCVAPAPDLGSPGTTDPEPNGSETVDASVVLRVDVEDGHTVTFYEPTPGGLYLAERMAPGQKFLLGDHEASDALAAFARLRPQSEVPAALQAAYDRARNLTPSEPVALAAPTFGGGQPEAAQAQAATPGVIQQALTSSSSAANFVNNNGGCNWGPEGSACRVNWGGGFFASLSPTTSGLCIVDHYAGNGVTIQITVGGTITSTFQGAGTIAQYSLGAAGGATTRRIDVTNASGDSFHAGCRWGI